MKIGIIFLSVLFITVNLSARNLGIINIRNSDKNTNTLIVNNCQDDCNKNSKCTCNHFEVEFNGIINITPFGGLFQISPVVILPSGQVCVGNSYSLNETNRCAKILQSFKCCIKCNGIYQVGYRVVFLTLPTQIPIIQTSQNNTVSCIKGKKTKIHEFSPQELLDACASPVLGEFCYITDQVLICCEPFDECCHCDCCCGFTCPD